MFSLMRIPNCERALSNVPMKTVDEIRRENLAVLRDEAGGVGKLAELIERGTAQVSQWLNGSLNSKTQKPRGMNDDTARHIEVRCSKPKGWLDKAHGEPGQVSAGNSLSPAEVLDLLALYGRADHRGRLAIMTMARTVVDGGDVVDDQFEGH
jgi:hypothetical protein